MIKVFPVSSAASCAYIQTWFTGSTNRELVMSLASIIILSELLNKAFNPYMQCMLKSNSILNKAF